MVGRAWDCVLEAKLWVEGLCWCHWDDVEQCGGGSGGRGANWSELTMLF